MASSEVFRFKRFEIHQDKTTMKVNTDGILLGAWSKVEGKSNALDIGTGTGLIALMLAQKNVYLHVTGIEIDEQAFIQAEQNFSNSGFDGQLTAYFGAVQDFADQINKKFDLIVSNPPFFSGGTFSLNENKANVRHTIKLSHFDLLTSVKKMITIEGHFDIILPYIEGLRFIEMAEKYDLYLHDVLEVYPRESKPIERLLMRFGLSKPFDFKTSKLIVYTDETSSDYSPGYISLTKSYYLYM